MVDRRAAVCKQKPMGLDLLDHVTHYNIIGKQATTAPASPLSHLIPLHSNSRLSEQLLCHQKHI
jgi:hypothetical protein